MQNGNIMRTFQKYTHQTGTSGNISEMNKKIIDVFSAFKHVEADIVGSSSGSGILNSGKKITSTKLLMIVRSTSGDSCYIPVWECLCKYRNRYFVYFLLGFKLHRKFLFSSLTTGDWTTYWVMSGSPMGICHRPKSPIEIQCILRAYRTVSQLNWSTSVNGFSTQKANFLT